MYCYLSNFKHFNLRIRTNEPNFSNILPVPNYYDQKNTAYSEHPEDKSINAARPLGKCVVLTHYYYASLMHNVLLGKAVTGVLDFYNKTPINWFFKKQENLKQLHMDPSLSYVVLVLKKQ